jgi:hypothetical protein
MSLRLAVVFLVGFVALSSANAQEIPGDKIPQTIGNKTVTLLTLGFRFPLYYASSGAVSGDGTAVGLSKYFNPKETGRWWVTNDRLCQKFPTWYKGKTTCFKLKSAGKNRLTWKRDDGFSGKALISG